MALTVCESYYEQYRRGGPLQMLETTQLKVGLVLPLAASKYLIVDVGLLRWSRRVLCCWLCTLKRG
jgi:hypothetical protein